MSTGDAGPRRRRLSRSGDFDRVFRDGSSKSNRYLVAYQFPRDEADDEHRLGLSVGKAVGGAVERNRVKRVLREAFWDISPELQGPHDFVVVARKGVFELVDSEGKEGLEPWLREVLRLAPRGGSTEERST